MSADSQSALQLRDIHLPGDAAFWPPAPGWWLLALLGVGLLAWASVVGWRAYRIRRQRGRLFAALGALEADLARGGSPDALSSVSILLRRLALMRYPREKVAALTGTAWLDFLDDSGGGGRFRNGPGHVLASGPYQRSLPAGFDAPGLVAVVRDWIKNNTGR